MAIKIKIFGDLEWLTRFNHGSTRSAPDFKKAEDLFKHNRTVQNTSQNAKPYHTDYNPKPYNTRPSNDIAVVGGLAKEQKTLEGEVLESSDNENLQLVEEKFEWSPGAESELMRDELSVAMRLSEQSLSNTARNIAKKARRAYRQVIKFKLGEGYSFNPIWD